MFGSWKVPQKEKKMLGKVIFFYVWFFNGKYKRK